ncbi:MAG TPA: alanine--tRNA ligase, partial [Acetobacteraceae bacterium]|nr:alanine--tRNA ligase [Acetobacteraceae bacterium]
ILQGVTNNYDIDLFRTLIAAIHDHVGRPSNAANQASPRVIADHLRASSFLIADGVLPSNEGRGYVLRRIMRRAMRHAHMMGAREPLLYRLLPALVRQMGAAYPELVRAEALISETMKLEETRFRSLLERGLHLLAEETARLGSGQTLPGEVAFRLYDTYGFPLDLTQDALRAEGRAVDTAGFEAAMAEQRKRARAAWAGSGEAATEAVWFDLRERVGATEFLGYTTETAEGEIRAIVQDGKPVDSAPVGAEVAVVLNQTPFYAESGGQVGDTGLISAGEACRIVIRDTQKRLGDLVVHLGTVAHGEAKVGLAVQAEVDHDRRTRIRAHHSATHLLHEALRRRLGTHVAQKGSLNAPDRLRFDVSHNKPMDAAELQWVEREVNARIRENAEVTTRLMTPEAAVEAGAMALFGEKYGEEVRVVGMGHDPQATEKHGIYSLELCGGTHVRRTGDIGLFRIVSEGAVSAGVRRVEAVTGEAALALIEEDEGRLAEAAAALKVAPAEVPARVAALVEERRRLERELAEMRKKLATGGAAAEVETVAGLRLALREVGETPARDLKGIAEAILKGGTADVVALVSTAEGKASIVVGLGEGAKGRTDAVSLVRAASAAVGGKGGGGRPEMAQAGGPDASRATEALAAVRETVASGVPA